MTSQSRTDALLRAAVKAAKVGLWDWDIPANKVVFSAEWKLQLGYAESEISDSFAEWESRVHPDDLPRMKQLLADYHANPWPDYQAEFRMRHKDGSWRWILTQADLVRGADGRPLHMIGSHIDITDQKRTVADLARSNRALRMLSDSNQALIRATSEPGLLAEVCRIAVEMGGYRMAWVGFAEPDAARTLRPVAQAGEELGYLTETEPTWGPGASGSGPAATAIQTGKPCLIRDIGSDPGFGASRLAAKERGYQSVIALPLMGEAGALGVLKIYSGERDAFDADEVAILGELAGDLAFGITTLRTRAERARAEEALRRTRANLELALDAAHLGDWSWDITTGEVIWSERCKALYGLPPGEEVSYERFLAAVHPEDRERTDALLQRAVETRSEYEIEKRVVWPDGSVHWNLARGRVFTDDAGRPVRMTGVTMDMTSRRLAEEAVRTAERRLSTLMDSFPDFVSRFDAAGRFTYISPSIGRTTGIAPEAILGHTPQELGVTGDAETDMRLQQSITRVLATGQAERLEVPFRTSAGPRPHEVRHIAELDEHGVVLSVLGIATDVTERKAAQRQLYLLNFALDNVGEGIFLMEGDSPQFQFVNRSAAETLGYSREELTRGMGILDIDPEWSPERWQAFLPVIRERKRMTIETTHRTRAGREIPVEVTGNYFTFEGQYYNMAIVRDVSERKAAEAALRISEREHRTLAENSPDMLIRWDRNLTRLYVNPAFAAALDRPVESLVGASFSTGHQPGSEAALARVGAALRRVFDSGEPETVEHVFRSVQGPRLVQLRLAPERDEQGRVATVLGIARDITALKETERQLRSLTDHSPDIILRFDPEGRYLYANSRLAQLTGVPAADHIGKPIGSVTGQGAEELYRSLRRRIGEVHASGTALETEVTLPLADGEHTFNVRLIPEPDDSGGIASVLTVVREITEQKRAETALRASEQRFRQVTEAIDEVFWLTEADKSAFIYVSPAYERVFGRSSESLFAHPRSWLEMVHPDDRPRVEQALPLQAQGAYDLEYRIRHPNGEVRWIHDRAFPIRDGTGRVYRLAGVAEDVTVRRQLEEQLRQAQKMDAVGQLAGGIAHDFNNMLAVIQMQATLLLEDAADTPETRDGLREILGATERASNLTRQLLTFSRRQVTQPVELDIRDTIDTMTRMLRRLLGEDVTLETRFAPALPLIHADPGMMEQVLMNLAINARDAMPGGGRLTVTLDPLHVSEQRAALHPGAAAGRYVCLSVTDSGRGIPAADLPHIFEPFFTTKEVGKGTGLGLATVFGIVQQHRGWIEVDSTLGVGTRFQVFLPAGEGPTRPRVHAASGEAVHGGNETILLVEDEAAVRAVTRQALERYGYRVLEADSAAAAIAVWEAAGGAHLLLTDLIMPGGTSGRELAEVLLARAPELRVIYCSGYSPDLVNRMLHLDPGRTLLQKPYAAAELAAAVRRCLDEGPA